MRAFRGCGPPVCRSGGLAGAGLARDNAGFASAPLLPEHLLTPHVLWLHELRLSDLAQVGGKNSSLGEMIGHLGQLGVSVPGGFATTADAYREFVEFNRLAQRMFARLEGLDVEDVAALTRA